MAKNFDQEWESRRAVENRTFVICGETFVLKKAIRPELFDQMQDTPEGGDIADTFAVIDDQFLSMIEDGEEGQDAAQRYRALRAQPDALGVRDLREVIDWMVEEATGRPPTSQSDLPRTPARTARRSTGGSSSRGLAAVSQA
jgi:hypothetical protein